MLISAVSPVLNTGDTIAISIRSGNTTQSSQKRCLITLKFISSAPGLLFVFREKKASFNSFIDRDWLGKAVLALFKKLSDGIDGLRIFFAKVRSIFPKYLLNSFAVSSSPVFILLPILSFRRKFDFLLFCFTNYFFHNSPSFLYVMFELEYLLWVVFFDLRLVASNTFL